jgi:glucokinase
MNILCLDIGGTNLRAAIIGKKGPVLQRIQSTPYKKSTAMLKMCLCLIKDIKNNYNFKINAISIGCAGPVKNSIMEGSKPMGISKSIDFKKFLLPHFKIPIFVANDLQMAIRAEKIYGHGQKTRNFALISISTGIGVSIFINNSYIENRVEIGHSIVETNKKIAKTCLKKHKGCWVAQASGSAIQNYLKNKKNKISIEMFFKKTNNKILKNIISANAIGITHVINAYDPEKIIIMGSLGLNQFNKIMPSNKMLNDLCFLKPVPPILKSNLGDEIGLLGAYVYAREKLVN